MASLHLARAVRSTWPAEAAGEGPLPLPGRPGRCAHGWARGPVIVGGLSDSGTRGAKYVLEHMLNVTMQNASVLQSGDDLLMNEKIAAALENLSDFERVAGELCEAVKQDWELAGRPMGIWGFKSPRSILLVPLWNYLFEDNYRFVHVVRDPRFNCAPHANKVQYRSWCRSVLPEEECVGVTGCFRYWAKVNGAAREAFSAPERRSRYVYMSMDRLVLPEPAANSSSYRMLERELPKLASLDPGGAIAVDEPLILRILAEEHKYAPKYQADLRWGSLGESRDKLLEVRGSVGWLAAELGYYIGIDGIKEEYDAV